MDELKRIESLLREGGERERRAAAAAPTAIPEETLRALRPAMAHACLRIERQRRLCRQRLMMLLAVVPCALMLALAGHAALTGDAGMLRAMAWPAGVFSACALLTLPVMEHFLAANETRQTYQNGGSAHAKQAQA